jgi:DNA-directed RNA polymerase subunit H
LFEKYNISIKELPKISRKDPAIEHLDAKEGDIIRIERESLTAGKTVYYRGVVNG